MSSVSAEEAVAKAKAIAARLSGQQTDESESSSGKRKRWGVAPDDPDSSKKSKLIEEPLQKRLWISTSDAKPPSHFVYFLNKRFPSLVDTFQTRSDDEPKLSIELHGRGSSNKPPIPGMPLEPLHVLITGPPDTVNGVLPKVENLLLDAENAPLEQPPPEEEPTEGALTSVATDQANNSSSYRPASVAQLIGQAHLTPDVVAGGDLMEETINIPNGVVGFIIGRGGENITSMQVRTGCKVQIQKEHDLQPGQTQRVITLQATTQQAIDECRQIIENMVQERVRSMGGPSSNGVGSKDRQVQDAIAAGHVHVQLAVPDSDVGLVIGRQGSTIKSIQEQSGASIQVPSTGDSQGMRTVNITHPNEQGANYAKQLIQDLLKSKPSFAGQQAAQGPQVTIQVVIPDKDVGLCIGRQGCVIKHMQNVTSARIMIPSQSNPGEMHRLATVTGTQEGCSQVQSMIEQIIADQSSASVMSGAPRSDAYGYQQQQQPYQQPDSQQGYSAEWAAYHAAQAAVQQRSNQQNVSSAPTAAAPTPATGPTASDAYYEQFFRYAYYYGEDAARKYYGAWSPPPGTPNPYGTNPNGIQPAPAPATAAGQTQQAAPTPAPQPASASPVAAIGDARETSRRKVSNLPAWMTKG